MYTVKRKLDKNGLFVRRKMIRTLCKGDQIKTLLSLQSKNNDLVRDHVISYLNTQSLGNLSMDSREIFRISSELLCNETVRMLHISIMEILYARMKNMNQHAGPRSVPRDVFDLYYYSENVSCGDVSRRNLHFVPQWLFNRCHGKLNEPVIVPLVMLNDHRDALGFQLGHGRTDHVLKRFSRLRENYENMWKYLNIRVRIHLPSKFLEERIQDEEYPLEYLRIEFQGFIQGEDDNKMLQPCDLYTMSLGILPQCFNRAQISLNPKMMGEIGNQILFGFSMNSGNSEKWLTFVLNALDNYKQMENQKNMEELTDFLIVGDKDYAELEKMLVLNNNMKSLAVSIMVKTYHVHIDTKNEVLRSRLLFFWSFMLNPMFCCMLHFHLGSYYRQGPLYYRGLRCNTMEMIPEINFDDILELEGVRTQNDFLNLSDLVTEGIWRQINWHTPFASRLHDIFIPFSYWSYLEDLYYVNEQQLAPEALSMYAGSTQICNLLGGHLVELSSIPNAVCSSSYTVYLNILQSVLGVFGHGSDEISMESVRKLSRERNVLLLKQSEEVEDHFSDKYFRINDDEDMVVLDDKKNSHHVFVGAPIVVSLQREYQIQKTEFDYYRPQLKNMNSTFFFEVN